MMMLENTSGGRPSKFCGNTCANPTTADGCGAAYEAEWALYIKELVRQRPHNDRDPRLIAA